MASWMIHLRVADILLDRLSNLSSLEFIMGNIAPDSGVPNEDWTSFSPSTKVSHFRTDSAKKVGKSIDIDAFVQQYFTDEQLIKYTPQEFSFFLGYLAHLLTDTHWSEKIAVPTTKKFAEEYESDHPGFIERMKGDWYDLDFLYLKEHPDFRAFKIYKSAVGFNNTFIDIFSPDALDNRREYITGFYLEPHEDLDHPYLYLTRQEADNFVESCVASILDTLKLEFSIQ